MSLSHCDSVRSYEMVACGERAHSFLFCKVVARPHNVRKSAPRLDAEIGRCVLVPENKIIESVKLNCYASCTYLALKGHAVALNVFENKRIKGKMSVVENETVRVIYHKFCVIGAN